MQGTQTDPTAEGDCSVPQSIGEIGQIQMSKMVNAGSEVQTEEISTDADVKMEACEAYRGEMITIVMCHLILLGTLARWSWVLGLLWVHVGTCGLKTDVVDKENDDRTNEKDDIVYCRKKRESPDLDVWVDNCIIVDLQSEERTVTGRGGPSSDTCFRKLTTRGLTVPEDSEKLVQRIISNSRKKKSRKHEIYSAKQREKLCLDANSTRADDLDNEVRNDPDSVNHLLEGVKNRQESDCKMEQSQPEGGALWDIFRRDDAERLQEYLRVHSREFRHIHCSPMDQVAHPIHDQSFYLTLEHKRKLKEEFGIEPWTFEQKLGEAVFIPAGCPHQVRNLKSCIKVALDFVSPENVRECVRLTEEFRVLPQNHMAKEDKLEVKKMALHALIQVVKDVQSCKLKQESKVEFKTKPSMESGSFESQSLHQSPSQRSPHW